MMEFWVSMGVSLVLSGLQQAIKNENSKAAMKRAMRKVFDAILMAYPEFKDE